MATLKKMDWQIVAFDPFIATPLCGYLTICGISFSAKALLISYRNMYTHVCKKVDCLLVEVDSSCTANPLLSWEYSYFRNSNYNICSPTIRKHLFGILNHASQPSRQLDHAYVEFTKLKHWLRRLMLQYLFMWFNMLILIVNSCDSQQYLVMGQH